MSLSHLPRQLANGARLIAVSAAIFQMSLGFTLQAKDNDGARPGHAVTPIQHVIIIVGENRTFDHLFATYKPKHGESVDNLLSKGIIHSDGSPGPNYSLASQYSAIDDASTGYQISPGDKTIYSLLPPPLTGGPKSACASNGICTLTDAQTSENGLPAEYYQYLLTGGTGQASHVPDVRIANDLNLPRGPFQLTSATFPYDSYAASPVHRFYQMWQQTDCNVEYATVWNPSGCKADLFPWVEVTVGAGTNGQPQPTPFTDMTTGEGSTAMGFYNMQNGDVPYFKQLADQYSMSDNYHQPVMGGTGANSLMLGFADAIWSATPTVIPPPLPTIRSCCRTTPTKPALSMKSKIRTPSPAPTTGIPRMAMAVAALALADQTHLCLAVARIPIAPTYPHRE